MTSENSSFDIPAAAFGQPADRLPLADLTERISDLRSPLEAADAAAWSLYVAAPEEVKSRIDVGSELYEEALGEQGADTDIVLSDFFTDHGDGLSGEFLHNLRKSERLRWELNYYQNELDSRAEAKASEVSQIASSVSALINYDKVLDSYLDPDDKRWISAPVHYVTSLARSIKINEPDCEILAKLEDGLLHEVTILTQNEMLKAVAETEQEAPATVPDIREKAVQYIDVYDSMVGFYDSQIDTMTAHHVRRLLALGRATKDPIQPDNKIALDTKFAAAIEQKLVKTLENTPIDTTSDVYLRQLEHARAIDTQQALDRLVVALPDSDEAFPFSQTEIKDFLLEKIPPLALDAVDTLEVRPIYEHETGKKMAGFHLKSEKSIVISDLREYEHDPSLRKNRLLYLLAHEYAHGFHRRLPAAALHRWHTELGSQPQMFITKNVEVNSGGLHEHAEDFADSMAMYALDPTKLRRISPVRFLGMKQLYEEYMPQVA